MNKTDENHPKTEPEGESSASPENKMKKLIANGGKPKKFEQKKLK